MIKSTATVSVNATAHYVQDVARQLFGRTVSVGGARLVEVTLPTAEAEQLAAELRDRGHEVDVEKWSVR